MKGKLKIININKVQFILFFLSSLIMLFSCTTAAEHFETRIIFMKDMTEESRVNKGLGKIRETKHLIYYAENTEEDYSEAMDWLDSRYETICSRYHVEFKFKIIVEFYKGLDSYHKTRGKKNGSPYHVGVYKKSQQKVMIVSPYNPGPHYTYDYMLKTLVHEFTHAITENPPVKPLPFWLSEGIAMYEGGQDPGKGNLDWAIGPWGLRCNPLIREAEFNSKLFKENGSHHMSFAAVKYIVERLGGYNTLNAILANPNQWEKVLKMKRETFFFTWWIYLKMEY